jgi:hypothetical protein
VSNLFRVTPTIRSLFAAAVIVLVVVLLAASAAGAAGPAGGAQLIPVVSNETGQVTNVAFDTQGDMFISQFAGPVQVLPQNTGTLFGQSVSAGTLTALNAASSLSSVSGLAIDSNGDLYLSNRPAGTVSVIPTAAGAAGGTIFGQAVTANTLTTLLSGVSSPRGLAFDGSGNLYVATQNGVSVLSATGGSIFGQSVSANTLTSLFSGMSEGTLVTFDAAGNLWVSDFTAGTVSVYPLASGTAFGHSVTADTLTPILTGLGDAAGLAFDPAGNLYVNYYGIAAVLPTTTGTLFGTPVTANTLTTLAIGLLGDFGSSFHAGHLYIADQLNGSIDELSTATATITKVQFGGTTASPVIVITGTGFETSPPTGAASCSASGLDYPYGNLYLADTTGAWGAGVPGDCIGLNVTFLSNTVAEFTFGDFYTPPSYALNPGDKYTVGVDGFSYSGTVAYSAKTYMLTVSKAGKGSGTVTSSPSGIHCGSRCSHAFGLGTQVTLTATHAHGSSFAGWSGSGCSGTSTCQVAMNAGKKVKATFTHP